MSLPLQPAIAVSAYSPQCLHRYFPSLLLPSYDTTSMLTCPSIQPVPLARSQIQTQIREQQLIALGFTTAIDAPNRVSNPKESFIASEGIYNLREEISLSVPPPHPSEPLIMQPNPIATNPLPVTAGTQACIISAGVPPRQNQSSPDSGSNASILSGHNGSSNTPAAAAGIYAPLSPALKRKKPKNNIAKTNSSFVSRIITHESLQKRLTERKLDDVYAFVNVARAFEWLDMTTADKVCFKFRGLIVGYSLGEIIVHESSSYMS